MLEFIKDYGSFILSGLGGFFVMLYKIFRVVHQSEMLNTRMEKLEEQFTKLDEKLDKVLECQRV